MANTSTPTLEQAAKAIRRLRETYDRNTVARDIGLTYDVQRTVDDKGVEFVKQPSREKILEWFSRTNGELSNSSTRSASSARKRGTTKRARKGAKAAKAAATKSATPVAASPAASTTPAASTQAAPKAGKRGTRKGAKRASTAAKKTTRTPQRSATGPAVLEIIGGGTHRLQPGKHYLLRDGMLFEQAGS